MKKFFIYTIFFLFVSPTFATIHVVQVGLSNTTTFTPNNITDIEIGDIIRFTWVSGSHTTFSLSVPSGAASWNNAINVSNTTFDYTITETGLYTYQCGPHGASMQGQFSTVGTSIKAENQSIYHSFQLSPNPAKEDINISFSADKKVRGTVSIIDEKGNLIQQNPITIEKGDNKKSYSTSSLTPGLYYITIENGVKSYTSQKFIKE